jgi:hypothetical protein
MKLLDFMGLFPEFKDSSWSGWRKHLKRLNAGVREFYAVVGRGAGKSRIVALIATWYASRPYHRAPGEHIYVGIFGPDRKQAAITFRYVIGLLRSDSTLEALIVSETKDSVELSNGIVIEVITASVAAPRGRAYALAIVEEAAFLPTDTSVNPDVELLRALRPALARVPGSLLVVVSSPYARRGVLWDAWKRLHGQPDGAAVFVQAPTLELNPTFDQEAVARAYEEDPASAAAEFGGQFRSDVGSFVSREALEAAVVTGRIELPPLTMHRYFGFVDPSGGTADSFTAAVAHIEKRDGQEVRVLDAVREIKPSFSPEQAVRDLSVFLKSYRVARVEGDRYAGEWPREQFRKQGIQYALSERAKSDIYRDSLPLVNSGLVELLDQPRLLTQLGGLERRTGRGGRDSIDHAPGGHDDVANAACGALVGATGVHLGVRIREYTLG